MEAKNVNIPAGADAEFDAKLVGGEGDVAGGDIGPGIFLADGAHPPFVQRQGLQKPETLAEGPQRLGDSRPHVQVRVPPQFG